MRLRAQHSPMSADSSRQSKKNYSYSDLYLALQPKFLSVVQRDGCRQERNELDCSIKEQLPLTSGWCTPSTRFMREATTASAAKDAWRVALSKTTIALAPVECALKIEIAPFRTCWWKCSAVYHPPWFYGMYKNASLHCSVRVLSC